MFSSHRYRIEMFNFFKIVPMKNSFEFKDRIIAYCSNSTYKIFCTIDEVQIFLTDWDCITLHVKDLKFCCIPENSNYLYLISQHTITRKVFLNIYKVSTQSCRKSAVLISTCIFDNNSIVTALSAFYISESQLCLAIGLENGNIIFYKNTLQKEILFSSLKNSNVTTKPIRGIRFSKSEENISMFVCSDAGIFCFKICSNLRLLDTKIIIDEMDSNIHCIAFKPSCKSTGSQCLFVARENGVYCYTAEGRGPCYAINGNKQSLDWFGKYLIVLLKIKCLNTHDNKTQMVVYDIENKIIVLDKQLDEVVCLLPVSGHTNCLIILKNGKIFTLREKEIKYKLACVIRKNLYDLALKLLEESKVHLDVSDVLIQYGDYVLQRGDSLEAVKVYTKTIGTVPTFLIIKKLKDFRYNDILIQYLTKLVETEFKIPEHLDLLNNCVRRINLPKTTLRLFEIEDNSQHQQLIYFATINRNLNLKIFKNCLQQEQYFSPYFFYEYSNAEAEKFFSECGYYLIKKYPNSFKDLTKYSLSEHSLNNSFQQILLPLSLMNKLCAPYFIGDLLKKTENVSTYNILTELVLQMWHKGHLESNFVVEFLKSNQMVIGTDGVIVLCRHYKFWPGIKMMYDKCSMETLSNHCLTKCFENFPEYVNIYSEEDNNLNQMVIQALKKKNRSQTYTLKYVTAIAKYKISSNPYYILNMLSSFVNSNDFLISHLDDFLIQNFFFTFFKSDELYTLVPFLESQVICIEEVLENYLRRPIEFRNRSCDICKHIIKQPSVFFLCQHSFHRECVMQSNEHFECIVCKGKQNSIKEANNSQLDNKLDNQSVKSNIMRTISKKIVKIPFQSTRIVVDTNTKKATKSSNKIKQNEKSIALNPFEKETNLNSFVHNVYDDNLNPFTHE